MSKLSKRLLDAALDVVNEAHDPATPPEVLLSSHGSPKMDALAALCKDPGQFRHTLTRAEEVRAGKRRASPGRDVTDEGYVQRLTRHLTRTFLRVGFLRRHRRR